MGTHWWQRWDGNTLVTAMVPRCNDNSNGSGRDSSLVAVVQKKNITAVGVQWWQQLRRRDTLEVAAGCKW